jgi:ubiquinone/menaquinone biosynthesis C-methylase UbiE
VTGLVDNKDIYENENEKEFIIEYWNGRSICFADLRRAELLSNKYERWQEEIKRHLPNQMGLKILDVGCGCGFFSVLLTKLGHQVIGIDLSSTMIEQGKSITNDLKIDTKLLVMDAEALEFDSESFDVVIARNVTWNLPHPKVAYKEWLRVLKKGGCLLNYDAEYAKNHHEQVITANNAHNRLTNEERDKCHKIYHMLEVSVQNRPKWDVEVLKELESEEIEVDLQVGERIYLEKDEFYIPTPMFAIKAFK